ncbi:MAG TPA: DUF2127 domain-containing protein [Dokdonella sp.]
MFRPAFLMRRGGARSARAGKPRAAPDGVRALRLIALFKAVKAVACVLLAVEAFRLVRADAAANLWLRLDSLVWLTRHGVVVRLLDRFVDLGPRQFRLFGSAALLYAVLYVVQAVGLWRGRRWAEYLVVGEIGLLLPFELWELVHRPSGPKGVVLLVNLAVAAYLVHALRRHPGRA